MPEDLGAPVPPPPRRRPRRRASSNRPVMLVLSYLGILALIRSSPRRTIARCSGMRGTASFSSLLFLS